ncbi:methionyl-tRNA formyltransferase [Cyclobacterium xiamenense]|uniref:methionyl-tRNA formyltransferase n=1 Tax=Cyclobacterium xiamenense TaxID=1297121 RepID=UPI0012B826A1|nr:methionyl-tRNA formyltransferase [Cyclobacterium xiamenense]
MKIALLISGGLGLKVFDFLKTRVTISAILTDGNSEAIISQAGKENISCFVGKPRKGKAQNFIADKEIDLLLSINYLFLIEKDLIAWPKRAAVNFHGSLLPKYRGRTPHIWAIINNEDKTGITCHFISEGCDEGDIILQEEVSIAPNDTGAMLLGKFYERYPSLVTKVIELIQKGEVKASKQDEELATFFGKRKPEDGAINWNWQKERIRNWVRAQAHPYPGAFTHMLGKKVIIDEVAFDNYGYRDEYPNGLILSINPVRVKTPNGVVRLTTIREGNEHLRLESILKS